MNEELLYFEEIVFEPGQTEYTTSYSYTDKTATDYKFLAVVRSDCYFGLDTGKEISLKFIEYTGPEVSVLAFRRSSSTNKICTCRGQPRAISSR